MRYEIQVLRAMLRLARRRERADVGRIVDRVQGPSTQVREALRRLEAAGLVERRPEGPRLTLAGFAVAVATVTLKTSAKKGAPKKRAHTRAA